MKYILEVLLQLGTEIVSVNRNKIFYLDIRKALKNTLLLNSSLDLAEIIINQWPKPFCVGYLALTMIFATLRWRKQNLIECLLYYSEL